VDLGIGLVVFGGHTGPQHSCCGRVKRVTSPISATKIAARTGPTPRMGSPETRRGSSTGRRCVW
jgi:hypothetical protein